MTPEQAETLRNQAAGLRLKASTGILAVAAARDLAAILPRELADAVSAAIESGELRKEWEKAQADALDALSNLDNNGEVPAAEVALHAMTAMLAWHGRLAQRVANTFAGRLESERCNVEGRAKGIEDALALIDAK